MPLHQELNGLGSISSLRVVGINTLEQNSYTVHENPIYQPQLGDPV